MAVLPDQLRVDVSYPELHAFLAPDAATQPFGGAEVRATLTGLLLRDRGFAVRFVVHAHRGRAPASFDGVPVIAIDPPRRDWLDDASHDAGRRVRAAVGRGLDAKSAPAAAAALAWGANTARGWARQGRGLFAPRPHPELLAAPADITLCFFASPFHARTFAAAQRTGTTRIYCPTDDEQLRSRTDARQRLITRYLVRHADGILAQTPEQRRLLPETAQARAEVFFNPAPRLSWFPHLAQAAHPAPDTPYALWIGRDNRHKNPAALLALAEALPDVRFQAVMTHPAGQDTHEVWRDRLPAHVQLHRRVPFQDAAALIEGARVFVSTSRWEGFANTFLQAAAAGVPVASLHVDPAKLLSREVLGRFAAHDPTRLQSDVRRLMVDDELHARIGRRARAHVEQHHDPDRYGDALAGWLRRVYATRRGRRRPRLDTRVRGAAQSGQRGD